LSKKRKWFYIITIIIIGRIFTTAMQLLCETLTPEFCEIPFEGH